MSGKEASRVATDEELNQFKEKLLDLDLHADALVICKHFGASLREVRGMTRSQNVADARHAMMAMVARKYPHWSLPAIGRLFARDHTTVLSALRKMEVPTRRVRILTRAAGATPSQDASGEADVPEGPPKRPGRS